MKNDFSQITISKTGPGTSIQDLGRFGFGQFGIPISGAMDTISMRWVNHILQNPESDAVLEISQPGLILRFDSPTLICTSGARISLSQNESSVDPERILSISSGDILEFGSITEGARVYLGIKDGFKVPEILDSKSSYEGITEIGMLKKGSSLHYKSYDKAPSFTASKVAFNRTWFQEKLIPVYPGPEWGNLSDETKSLIQSQPFTLSTLQNRMAIQLEEGIPNSLEEMATAAVYPGTVQLTSGGKMIILMKDAQVTGGYPRILQLPEKSIAQLAQKKPKEQIFFKLIQF